MLSYVARIGASVLMAGMAISAAGGRATAADLKSDPMLVQHPMYQPPSWSGLYFGANLGHGVGHIGAHNDPFSFNSQGVVGGLHAGYNRQIRNFVVGVEGDFDWAGMRGRALVDGDTITGKFHNFGSVRGRMGFAVDRLMVYGTVGYGWTNVGLSFNDGVTTLRRGHTNSGIVYGTGIEYKLFPNVSMRAEVLRFDASGHWRGDDGSRVKLHTPAAEARAGLTWHINTFR